MPSSVTASAPSRVEQVSGSFVVAHEEYRGVDLKSVSWGRRGVDKASVRIRPRLCRHEAAQGPGDCDGFVDGHGEERAQVMQVFAGRMRQFLQVQDVPSGPAGLAGHAPELQENVVQAVHGPDQLMLQLLVTPRTLADRLDDPAGPVPPPRWSPLAPSRCADHRPDPHAGPDPDRRPRFQLGQVTR